MEIQNELEGIFNNDYKRNAKNESCSFKEEIEEIKKWINEREGLTGNMQVFIRSIKNPLDSASKECYNINI